MFSNLQRYPKDPRRLKPEKFTLAADPQPSEVIAMLLNMF